MFQSAFITRFSIPEGESEEVILKRHLLSNREIIIPASAIGTTKFGIILSKNIDNLIEVIKIAHGNDIERLTDYIFKYENAKWDDETKNVFKEFEKRKRISVYKTEDTIDRFNKLMKACAAKEIPSFSYIFTDKNFCERILSHKENFTLMEYMDIVNREIRNEVNKKQIIAHAYYFYNYFGSISTGGGNTFSIENMPILERIMAKSLDSRYKKISGIDIILSCFVDVISSEISERFFPYGELENDIIRKISYKDIFEIRESWLHDLVLKKYDDIVKNCIKAYKLSELGDIEKAIKLFEQSLEIYDEIRESIKIVGKREVALYKKYIIVKFLSETLYSIVPFGYFQNLIEFAKNAYILSTEVIFYDKDEIRRVKNAEKIKKRKIEYAIEYFKNKMGAGHPTITFLLDIANRMG